MKNITYQLVTKNSMNKKIILLILHIIGQTFLQRCWFVTSNIHFYKQQLQILVLQIAQKGLRLVFYLMPARKERVLTKELKENLNLAPIKRDAIMIQPFGKENYSIENLDVVVMQIRNLQTSQFKIVEALVVPRISKPVKNQFLKDVQKHYTILADIQLVDSN